MRKTLSGLLAAAVVAGGLLIVAPVTQAADLTVSHTPLSTTTAPGATCTSIPVTWYVTVPAGTDYWVIEGDVLNAAGLSVDDFFELEDFPITQTSNTLSICGLTGPGTFTFRLYGQLRAEFDRGVVVLDETFTVTVPAPAPPPPPPVPVPVPQNYTTMLKLDKNVWFKRATVARFGGSLEIDYSCPAAYCIGPGRKVSVQGLRNGNWTTIYTKGGISSSVYLKIRVPYKYSKIRAEIDKQVGNNIYSADTSNTVRVPSKR